MSNPYSPPSTDVDLRESASRRPIAFVILGLAALQLIWLLLVGRGMLMLVQTGAANALSALTAWIGCLLLYLAAVRFAMNAAHGSRLFLAALVLTGLSLKGWAFPYFWSFTYVFAALIAAAGWWLARPRGRQG
ncbi:hypothetical protein [Pelomonas sp. KK5]|uniref:hypothetical protein n=1 Tax=Pelomonas sp. KK5 TaxID=1855730 RepID=UPI00097CA93D|nr:hypothetical protein [Pelomonas sp. KK5]